MRYSKCLDYFKYASAAIDEMFRQKGSCKFDKDGNILTDSIKKNIDISKYFSDGSSSISASIFYTS